MPESTVLVKIFFFAKAKDLTGTFESTIQLVTPIPYPSLLDTIVEQFKLNPLRHSLVLALNEEYLEDTQQIIELKETDCLAVIPPISGGN